jgi:hypothetical protein
MLSALLMRRIIYREPQILIKKKGPDCLPTQLAAATWRINPEVNR